MKNGLLPTFYNKDNFLELEDDMVNFIQENIQKTKNGKRRPKRRKSETTKMENEQTM